MRSGHRPRGGVAIDDACRTSDADIYAIGECAAWNGMVYGLVAPGYDMARVVAKQLCGDANSAAGAAFAGADMSTKLKLMGVDVASIGDAHGTTAGSRTYQYADERHGSTRSSWCPTAASSCTAR